MLSVSKTKINNKNAATILEAALASFDGSLFFGYPTLAKADLSYTFDAILVSKKYGLTAFDFIDDKMEVEDICEKQDNLFHLLNSHFSGITELHNKRKLAIDINIVSFSTTEITLDEDYITATKDNVAEIIKGFAFKKSYFTPLKAAIQHTTKMKPPKKRHIQIENSKGYIIKEIEKSISNLDPWQETASIECPDKPQRIRGLAGSGKTIVLALKATEMHISNPSWTIGLTFQSRTLYQQFKELVTRFCFHKISEEPDWDKFHILHAWGNGYDDVGVYSMICEHTENPIRSFGYGSSKFGREDAFGGVCKELLRSTGNCSPIFDALLIDEAQDMPPSFFKLAYKFTTEPKRVVWAYDELQNLSENSMPPLEKLFGQKDSGEPKVILNDPNQDLPLPVCYRNTPWALVLAHALGFGIYREKLIQLFKDYSYFQKIGYEIKEGELKENKSVRLSRATNSYPDFFEKFLTAEDAISYKKFEFWEEEIKWVVNKIEKNIANDELDLDDILIILPSAWTAKSKGAQIIQALNSVGINSHLVGVTASRNKIFMKGSVAISNIYRAKGNEAAMVYMMNCEFCATGPELRKNRNILFTGITRSRAWVTLTGTGTYMGKLIQEINSVKENNWTLNFRLPTPEELEQIHSLNQDLSPKEKEKLSNLEKLLSDFKLEDLPPDIRKRLLDGLNDV